MHTNGNMHQRSRKPESVRRIKAPGVMIAVVVGVVLLVIFFAGTSSSTSQHTSRLLRSLNQVQQEVKPTYGDATSNGLPEHADHTAVRVLKYSDPYGHQAQRNLSRWRANLFSEVQALVTSHLPLQPTGADRYRPFEPVVTCPPSMPQTRFGIEYDASTALVDGGKSLCAATSPSHPMYKECVVYSFGSNGQYDFEEAILANTTCSVHTFDCTFAGRSLGPRHTYHQLCLGAPDHAEQFQRISSYPQIVKELKHEGKVKILKIDVESFEWDVFSALKDTDSALLPDQLAVEFHYQDLRSSMTGVPRAQQQDVPVSIPHLLTRGRELSVQDMALMFAHLADLGYATVYKEMNPGNPSCFEYVFLRVEDLVLV